MSTIVTRAGKGSPLTHTEVDNNFTNLNTDKVEKSAADITGGSISGTSITVVDNAFTLQDEVDPTKQALFQLSGITTATTRTYTLPNITSALAATGTITQTFSGTTTFSAATVTVGSSTATSTYGLGSGATINTATKTVNIGTAGVSGSTTNINIGSAVSGSLGATNIQSPTFTHQGQVVIDAANITTYADPAGTAVALAIALG